MVFGFVVPILGYGIVGRLLIEHLLLIPNLSPTFVVMVGMDTPYEVLVGSTILAYNFSCNFLGKILNARFRD